MSEPIDLDALQTLSTKQLQAKWDEVGVRGEPPHFKVALVRGIAWHVQSKVRGGMDAKTRRLLKAAVRGAPLPSSTRQPQKNAMKRDTVTLSPGTKLVRRWHGHTHEVTVLESGKSFEYRSEEYASLSEIAREITGARWSGPRFFGLTKVKSVA